MQSFLSPPSEPIILILCSVTLTVAVFESASQGALARATPMATTTAPNQNVIGLKMKNTRAARDACV